jgi:ATP-binding cassette, subfamily B, bacterial MsbA
MNLTGLRNYLAIFLPYLPAYRWMIISNIIVVLIAALFEGVGIGLLVPVIQSIDGSTGGGFIVEHAKTVYQWFGIEYKFINLIAVFAAIILCKYMLIILQQHMSRVLSSTVTRDLRQMSMKNLLDVPLSFYHARRIGDIVATISTSTGNSGAILEYFVLLVRGVVFALTYLLLAAWMSIELTAYIFLTVAISYLLIWPRFRRGKEYGQQEKQLIDDIFSNIQDRVGGIKIIKAFNGERKAYNELSSLVSEYQKLSVRIMDNKLFSFAFFEPFLFLLLVIALVLSVQVFELQLAVLLVSIVVFMQIIPHFKAINNNVMVINELMPHFSRVDEFIRRDNKNYLADGGREINAINQSICYDNVSFQYNSGDAPVLTDITLTIPANTTQAFVGESGGGKSTLVDLLIRHYDPTHGEIQIDGRNLKAFTNSSWKGMLALVDQDCYLFHDTVYNNILYGKPDASPEDVYQAAKMAHAHSFITQMEEGYDSILGHRGMRLSGGQRQRIALARALIRKPRVLILDEATSALDSESEQMIRESLQQLHHKMTIIIIAHRIATIKEADSIIFIEQGKIVEQGTHNELVRLQGRYSQYITLQNVDQTGVC